MAFLDFVCDWIKSGLAYGWQFMAFWRGLIFNMPMKNQIK